MDPIGNLVTERSQRQTILAMMAQINALPVSVADFGAVGDGVTDDTLAFAAALGASHSLGSALSGSPTWAGVNGPSIAIPDGDYNLATWNWTAPGSRSWTIYAENPGNVRIRLPAGKWFLDTGTFGLIQLVLQGVHFYGGAGAVRVGTTGTNTFGWKVVRQCHFDQYTVCAIGSLADDDPRWAIENNIFDQAKSAVATGIALAGWQDRSIIQDNLFRDTKYGIKIGLGGVRLTLARNDFVLTDATQTPVYRLWFPPVAAVGNNAGAGLALLNNRFGNENTSANDINILIAAEAGTGGADFMTEVAFTDAANTEFMNAITCRDNAIILGSTQVSHLYSTAMKLADSLFDDVWIGNLANKTLFKFHADCVPHYHGGHNTVTISRRLPDATRAGLLVSNFPSLFQVLDRTQVMLGNLSVPVGYQQQVDPGYTDLLVGHDVGTSGSVTNATRADASDSASGGDAITLTWTSSTGFYQTANLTTPTRGRTCWLDLEWKSAAAQAVTNFQMQILATVGGSATTVNIYDFTVQSYWQKATVRINVDGNSGGAGVNYRARVLPTGFSAGVSDQLLLGRVKAYHAAVPQG